MPVYRVKIQDEPDRIVRASSAAVARRHVAQAEPMSADELADALAGGAEIETAKSDEGE